MSRWLQISKTKGAAASPKSQGGAVHRIDQKQNIDDLGFAKRTVRLVVSTP